MKPWRKVGHNVIHLLYPIRWESTGEKLAEKLNKQDWEEMFCLNHRTEEEIKLQAKHYFPSTYETVQIQKTFREVITNDKVIKFFHPSIQDTLFHKVDRGFRAFRYKTSEEAQQFYGEIDGERICFEWIASELYVFSNSLAFLVVRVSLLENWAGQTQQESVTTFATWMKFANRIRQNYRKYEGQNAIQITAIGREAQADCIQQTKFFYEFVEEFVQGVCKDWKIEPRISQVMADASCQKDKEFWQEPNAFIHAFVTSDFEEPLSEDELYQIIHIDDVEGESGGTAAFKQEFLQNNVYRRWENMSSYYTAIDYGTVTVVSANCTAYKGQSTFSFADLLYQHHCRHYLLMIVLQLYYREELQELLGKYSRLTELHDKEARAIADEFYTLNQHFFFKRISQEIQGRELWQFYYRVFDIQSLLADVQRDIQELNQRRIERNTEKQSKDIMKLTMITALTGLMGMNVVIPLFDQDHATVQNELFKALQGTVLLELWDVFSFFIFLCTVVLIGFVLWIVLNKK